MDTNGIIILSALSIPLIVTLVGFAYILRQDAANSAARRQVYLTRLNPDANGNYPAVYNQQTGDTVCPEPGNTYYPAEYHLYHDGRSITPLRGKISQPLIINAPALRDRASLVTEPGQNRPELAEPGQNRPELAEPGQNRRSEPDLAEQLVLAKLAGESKTTAIKRVLGVTRGGSTAWAVASEFWDGIQA